MPQRVVGEQNHEILQDRMKLPRITICGAADLRDLRHASFTHVVSIWAAAAPQTVVPRLESMFASAKIYVAFFDDVLDANNDTAAPNYGHVRDILEFGRTLTAEDSLLVQCLAGISRSSACAFSIACQHAGVGHEQEILQRLVKIRPSIRPNPQIVRMADEVLGRNGVMISVVQSYLDQFNKMGGD